MANPVPPPPFELRPFEDTMRLALATARSEDNRKLLIVAADGAENSLRGPFLRWLLLEAIPALELPLVHFELHNAEVDERLDLAGTKSTLLPRFVNCRFKEAIDFTDAEIAGFEMIAGRAAEILADRLVTQGSLVIRAADERDTYRPQNPAEWPPTIVKRIRLCGAIIHGNLDFRGCVFLGKCKPDEARVPLFADGLSVAGNLLLSYRFTANGEIRLNGCTVGRNLDCSGASLLNPDGYSFSAAGAHVSGSAYFCATKRWSTYPEVVSFQSCGSLRIESAKIDGDLDCTGGKFTALPFLSGVSWAPRVEAEDASNGQLYNIAASGVDVGGDVRLSEAFHGRGVVDLIAAKIGGDFHCGGGNFDFPGEEPLYADGITVSGTTFLDNGVSINGILRFPQASFKQGLYVEDAVFEPGGGCRNWCLGKSAADELGRRGICGIFAPLSEVNGKFCWKRIDKRSAGGADNLFWLHLADAKADVIDDEEVAWQRLDCFDVTGFDYQSILHVEPDVAWRIDELDRQYAALNPRRENAALYGPVAGPDFFVENCLVPVRAMARALLRWLPRWSHIDASLQNAVQSFSPLPYIQLAKTVRAAGYEKAANDVLVQLERNRTRYSDFGVFRQFGRGILGLVLRYGFAPFRPLLYLLAAAIISTAIFEQAYEDHLIVPAGDNAAACPAPASSTAAAQSADSKAPAAAECKAEQFVRFNALVFATDTLVPLVDLNQKKNWLVTAERPPSSDRLGRAPVPGPWPAFMRALAERPRWDPSLLYIFNIVFGWLMTSFVAAGVTGLVRSGTDAD